MSQHTSVSGSSPKASVTRQESPTKKSPICCTHTVVNSYPASSYSTRRVLGIIGIACISVLLPSIIYYLGDAEPCNGELIPQNHKGVLMNLRDHLFGQHLAQEMVSGALSTHVTTRPNKPLVLSFHGSVGTGKTYTTKWIVENWFAKSIESQFVHRFSGSRDFSHKGDIETYKKMLISLVYSQTELCQHQIFIFDEIDMAPPGLLDCITSYLEYTPKVGNVDFRKTIFVFLSNTGTATLRKMTLSHFQSDGARKDLRLSRYDEAALLDEIYNTSDTGLTRSRLIDASLISHFVPFLPLEKDHVKECIQADLIMKVEQRFTTKLVEDILDELRFHGPKETFSVNGCKGISDKVNSFILKRGLKMKDVK